MQEKPQNSFVFPLTSGQKILAGVIIVLGIFIVILTTVIGITIYKRQFSTHSLPATKMDLQASIPDKGVMNVPLDSHIVSVSPFSDTKLLVLLHSNRENGGEHVIIWDIQKARSVQDISTAQAGFNH